MSGCHFPIEYCPHGRSVSEQECNYCEADNKFAALTNRVNGLHANKLTQIDLNKKAEERIKELEKACTDSLSAWNLLEERLTDLEEWTRNDEDRIHERILKLESENKMRQGTIGCMDQAYNDALLDAEKRIEKLEKKIIEMRGLSLHPTKPHKCPVCGGIGKVRHPLNGLLLCQCEACQKGIIWG